MHVDTPGPSTFPGSAQNLPMTAPTSEGSCRSSPRSPTWPHMTLSEKDGIAPLVRFLTRPCASTALPQVPQDISNVDEDMEDVVSLPEGEDKDPTLWGCDFAPTFNLNDTSAYGIDDFYGDLSNEEYVSLPFHSDSSPDSLSVTAFNCKRLVHRTLYF